MLPSNWKLYMENVKDSYHASLLHTFFTTFRLNRLSQKGGLVISETGGNHISYSLAADTGGKEYEQAGMRAAQEGFGLEAPRDAAPRSTNTATASGCRSSRCSRPSCCSRPATASRCAGWCRMGWRRPSWSGPCFGFTDDDEAMTERRLAAGQPDRSGRLHLDGGRRRARLRAARRQHRGGRSVGGGDGRRGIASDDTRVTEASVRGFWTVYRAQMGL